MLAVANIILIPIYNNTNIINTITNVDKELYVLATTGLNISAESNFVAEPSLKKFASSNGNIISPSESIFPVQNISFTIYQKPDGFARANHCSRT